MKTAVTLLCVITGLVLANLSAHAVRPDIRWLGGGHNAEVRGLVVSPDGQWIASGCNDQTVKLWRSADGSTQYSSSAALGSAARKCSDAAMLMPVL